MSIISLFLIAVGLSMDAFAVSVTNGMVHKVSFKKALVIGAYFGGFQALMPMLGWTVGYTLRSYIESVDHWIAFVLLAGLGGKMIYEALKKSPEEACPIEPAKKILTHRALLLMAVATSIDALIVGVTFACLNVNILLSALLIGVVTFVISVAGVFIGKRWCNLFGNKTELLGGGILILIGLKILLEHLNLINF